MNQPCVERVAIDVYQIQDDCKTSCNGLHADVTYTDDLFDTFVTKQIKEQHSNLADGEQPLDTETNCFAQLWDS